MFWNYESRFYLVFLDAKAMPVIGWLLAQIQHLIHEYIKQVSFFKLDSVCSEPNFSVRKPKLYRD